MVVSVNGGGKYLAAKSGLISGTQASDPLDNVSGLLKEVVVTMKKHMTKLLAAVAMTWLGSSAWAGDPCTACEEPATRGGWYGSVGVMVLKQVGGSNPAFVTENYSPVDQNGQSFLVSSQLSEFDHQYRWAGRAEVGVKDASGFGLRVRYFWFEDDNSISFLDNTGVQSVDGFPGQTYNSTTGNRYLTANPVGINFASVGTESAPSQLNYDRNLRIQALDLDLTSDCRRGCLEVTWFGGIRFMRIEQDYNASERVLPPLENFEFPAVYPVGQQLRSSHSLDAWGPTVGVEARYPVMANMKAFTSARFGLLYAEGDQVATLALQARDPDQPPVFQVPFSSITMSRTLALPIGELELGGEYNRVLGCDGPELFVRGSVMANAYWGAGNAARVNSSNMPANEDLYFFGFAATVGIRY